VDTPSDRLAGHFERCVQFGPDADPSKATAHFDGENLTITVPKRKTWVDFVHRNGDSDGVSGEGPQNVDKSPRSIALALAASRHSTSGGGSPESESTTPESESAASSGSTDISDDTSISSPRSDDQCTSGESDDVATDNVTKKLEDLKVDNHRNLVSLETPSASPHDPLPLQHPPELQTPVPSHYVARRRSASPSKGGSHVRATSTAMRRSNPNLPSQPHSQSDSLSDSEGSNARMELGYADDDLVTPTPSRMKRTRGETSTSPKKDYFGFPLKPITSPRMPSRSEKHDPSPERRTASPPPPSNPGLVGRTREQGLGRGAFFWKRWGP